MLQRQRIEAERAWRKWLLRQRALVRITQRSERVRILGRLANVNDLLKIIPNDWLS